MTAARKASELPKKCKLARAILWEYSYKGLKLAQLLGQLVVFLTCVEREDGAAVRVARDQLGTEAAGRTSAVDGMVTYPRRIIAVG
jgi:hypothetical protein